MEQMLIDSVLQRGYIDPRIALATDTLNSAVLSDTVSAIDTARVIFGQASYVVADATTNAGRTLNPTALSDDIIVKLTTIVCLIAFIMLLYRYRGYFRSLVRTVVSKLYDEIHFEEQNRLFSSFLTHSILLGITIFALCIVKFLDIAGWHPVYEEYALSGNIVLPLIIIAELCIVVYQRFILFVSGRVALSSELTHRLNQARRRIYSLLSIGLTPLVLMFMYSNGIWETVFKTLIFSAIGAAIILLLNKSYLLFRGQKVSISIWILYLCAVEIFPVSLFVLAVLRDT